MDFAALWPHWLRPWSLVLLPLCAWLIWQLWHRERRSGRWQLLLPALFQSALLTGGRTQQNRLPWIALGLGWGLVPELQWRALSDSGALVALDPDRSVDVPLLWQAWSLDSAPLRALSAVVTRAAARDLHPPT